MRARLIAHLTSLIEKRYFVPAIGVLSIAASFIALISLELVLTVTVLLKPNYWIRVALALATGSAIGAFVFTKAIGSLAFFQHLGESHFYTNGWLGLNHLLLQHGLLGLTALVISPLPATPLYIYSVSLGIPSSRIFLAVWIGRSIKYLIVGRLVYYLPHVFHKRLHRKKISLKQTKH